MKKLDKLTDAVCNTEGKVRGQRWKDYKMGCNHLSESYLRLDMYHKAQRLSLCATDLYFEPKENGGMRLISGNFCRVALCPMCAMRRTRKIFGQVSRIMDYIEKNKSYRYIFLTLTVKNVSGDELSEMIDRLMKGFHAMIHHVKFKNMSKGWFRALEITHNWQRDDYHPHLHMVVAVDEKYFNQKKNYVSHDNWKLEWKKCMGLDYEPRVHVQRVRKSKDELKDGEVGYQKAVAEISKYTAKSMDYMVMWKHRKQFEKETGIKIYSKEQSEELTDSAVSVLDKSIHKRRLVAFGGELRKIHKLLNLDDPEDGDLVNTDDDEYGVRYDLNDVILHYKWRVGIGDYVLVPEE